MRTNVPTVTVVLPTALLNLFRGLPSSLDVPATTVRELVDALDARCPGIRDRLCDSTPSVRRHINIFVDGERADLATRLTPGGDVLIMTAMSGG